MIGACMIAGCGRDPVPVPAEPLKPAAERSKANELPAAPASLESHIASKDPQIEPGAEGLAAERLVDAGLPIQSAVVKPEAKRKGAATKDPCERTKRPGERASNRCLDAKSDKPLSPYDF